MNNALRQDLQGLAGEVRTVDLYERSMATAERSRRRRMAAVVAAGVAVVAFAATSVILWPGTRPAPDPIGPSPVVTSASAAPSPTPSPSATRALTLAELQNATLDVPTFAECGGRLTFTAGRSVVQIHASGPPTAATLIAAAAADAYGTGQPVTVAVLSCGVGQGDSYQAITVERADDGSIASRDVVTRIGPVDNPYLGLSGVRAAAAGSVEVEFIFPMLYAADQQDRQWRTFTWQGGRFNQTAGPTSFAGHPLLTRLKVTSTPLVLSRDGTSGYDLGSIVVTVTNLGTSPIAGTVIRVSTDNALAMFNGTAGQSDPTRPGVMIWPYNRGGGIAPGETLQVTIPWLIMYPKDPPPEKILCTIVVQPLTPSGQSMIELVAQTPVEVPVSHA